MAKAKVVGVHNWCRPHGGIGLAFILLVLGVFWLGKDIGWIDVKISIWPVLLIVLSAYWILKQLVWKKCCI